MEATSNNSAHHQGKQPTTQHTTKANNQQLSTPPRQTTNNSAHHQGKQPTTQHTTKANNQQLSTPPRQTTNNSAHHQGKQPTTQHTTKANNPLSSPVGPMLVLNMRLNWCGSDRSLLVRGDLMAYLTIVDAMSSLLKPSICHGQPINHLSSN